MDEQPTRRKRLLARRENAWIRRGGQLVERPQASRSVDGGASTMFVPTVRLDPSQVRDARWDTRSEAAMIRQAQPKKRSHPGKVKDDHDNGQPPNYPPLKASPARVTRPKPRRRVAS